MVKRLWRAVNVSEQTQLADARSCLFAAVEAALTKYAVETRAEWGEIGCEFVVPEITEAVSLPASELVRRLRRAIDEADTLPLSRSAAA